MGNLCFRDKDKFPLGTLVKRGEWVIFGRYAGSRFKIEGGEVRILNDDEIIAKIDNLRYFAHVLIGGQHGRNKKTTRSRIRSR
jgi:hypothetical protein